MRNPASEAGRNLPKLLRRQLLIAAVLGGQPHRPLSFPTVRNAPVKPYPRIRCRWVQGSVAAAFLLSFFTLKLPGQVATVERNVNLREGPSTNDAIIRLLEPPQELQVLDLTLTGGYYNVATAEEEQGWVWGRNVDVDPDADLEGLDVEIPAYKRTDWNHWTDEDGDCQDTRDEVLIRDANGPVQFDPTEDGRECEVISGLWVDPYSNETITDPTDLDIDHVVPLANAHLSGGWEWDKDRKREYANDLEDPNHLLAVKDSLNQSKGSKEPEEWVPPNEEFLCEYGKMWEDIKERWELSMTTEEADAVEELKDECN